MHHLLEVDTTELDPDIISARLWSLGVVGINEATDQLVAAFTDRDLAVAAADSLGVKARISAVDDREGLDTWRSFASCVEAGPFTICPPWVDPPEGKEVILIDPGHAFGSGSHPSTRLAIRALARELTPQATVLDVGCGSGVLSIAAARLGASVTAVDTDPEAAPATRTNARINGCEHLVSVTEGTASDVAGRFHVVVVNVTIDIHDILAEAVAERLLPDGTLIASGMLTGAQEQRLVDNFPELELIGRETEAEWAAVTMRRNEQ